MTELSVIIPTFDQWPRLRLVLSALTCAHLEVPWEVIVVDDGSTRPVAKDIENDPLARQLPLTVLRLDDNGGRSAARNLAVQHAHGEICVFLDGDAVPQPLCLQQHLEIFRRYGADYSVGHIRCLVDSELFYDPENGEMFSGLVLTPTQREELESRRAAWRITREQVTHQIDQLHERSTWGSVPMPQEQQQFWMRWLRRSDEHGVNSHAWLRYVPHNAAVRRDLFLKAGGFDTTLAFHEGVDLAWRLRVNGARCMLAEQAVTYHLYHYRSWGPGSGTLHARLRGLQQIVAKHPQPEVALAALLLGGAVRYPEEYRIQGPEEFDILCKALDADALAEIKRLVACYPQVDSNSDQQGPYLSLEPLTDAAESEHGQPGAVVSRAEVVRDLAAVMGVDPARAAQLDRKADYPSVGKAGGSLQYGLRSAHNWHLRHTPQRYQQWMASDLGRLQYIQQSWDQPRRERLEIDYELQIDTGAIDGPAWLFVPVPADTGHQRIMATPRFDPPLIEKYWLRNAGVIYALPVIENLRYRMSLETCETRAPSITGNDNAGRVPGRYLTLPGAYADRIRRHAETIVAPSITNLSDRLRTAYQWVLDNKWFVLSDQCGCLQCSAVTITQSEDATCSGIASSFVLLARAIGVPARLVRGMLCDHVDTELTQHHFGFSHVWAECRLDDTWLPMEFHSCLMRPPVLNPDNVPGREQRSFWRRAAEVYERYYFGSIDGNRLRTNALDSGVFTLRGRQAPQCLDTPVRSRIVIRRLT